MSSLRRTIAWVGVSELGLVAPELPHDARAALVNIMVRDVVTREEERIIMVLGLAGAIRKMSFHF